MKKEKRILLLGNVINDGSKSMQLVLEEYKQNYKHYSKIIAPSPKIINPKIFKLFVYPFIALFNRGYDVYHIVDHSYGHLAYFLPRDKTIITCHDMVPLLFPEHMSWRGLMMFKIYASGLKRAKIILSDPSTKEELMDLLKIDPKKIRVYPNNIDLNGFNKLSNRNTLRKKYGLDGKYVVMAFGNEFYKNVANILRAMHEIRVKCPSIIMLKIGDFGSREKEIIQDLKLDKSVMIKTNVPRQELIELYNCADIVSFPSLHHAFARPPIEAMACEVPTIVSNHPALREITDRDATVRVDPSSPKEIAAAILKIKNNSSFRRMLISHGKAIVKKFRNRNLQQYPQVLRSAYADI